MNRLLSGALFLALSTLLLVSCSQQKMTGKFSFSPQKPNPGDEVTVTFNPDSTKLAKSDSVNMVAYLYSVNPDNAVDVKMYKEGNYWKGKFKTADTTRGVLIKFVDASTEGSDNEVFSNNDNKGFVIHLYDKNGNVAPGSMAGLASAINSWATYYLNVNKNEKLAEDYFQQDFNKNPGIKDEYLSNYLALETSVNKSKQDSIVNNELAPIEAKKDKSEKDLSLLVNWFGKIKNTEKANQYKNILKKEYPKGNFVQMENYQDIYKESDINKQLTALNKFQNDFPNSRYTQYLYAVIVNKYVKNKDFKNAKYMLLEHKKKINSYYFYNTVKTMVSDNADLNSALELAKTGVEMAQANVDKPTDKKPATMTGKSWLENREYYLALNLYGEADVLDKLNKDKEAEPLLADAVKYSKGEEGDMNELYAKVLLANKEYDKALSKIEGFIKLGKSTKNMEDLFKQAYVKKNGSDKDFDKLLAKYQDAAASSLAAKIKSQLIDEPAPDFKLTDLEGHEISLKELKGKTVILDFWATWCGPCKASFPGMKIAVNKFADNPDVKFFFVNTWEQVKDKKENAQTFIKKNNYPFDVLLDTQNKVVGKYHVSGIPTKFFIDKNGNIRFKSIGFGGNTDQMVKEISTVISMLNKS